MNGNTVDTQLEQSAFLQNALAYETTLSFLNSRIQALRLAIRRRLSMSLFSIFELAGSGLSAQAIRLNVTASNLANADSVSSSVNQTYRARHAVFASVPQFDDLFRNASAVGVQVRGIVESQAPLPKEYRPAHPAADAEGYVYRSNVNVVEEMANMISASRTYQGNVEVINTTKQMLLRTLSLGR